MSGDRLPPPRLPIGVLVPLTVAFAAVVSVGLRTPLAGAPWGNAQLGVATETGATVVALLLAYLALGRFLESRLLRDLLLTYGISTLALTNLLLGAIPAVLWGSPLGAELSAPPMAVSLGAALLAASALSGEHNVTRATRTALHVAASIVVPATAIVLVLLVTSTDRDSPQLAIATESIAAVAFAVAAVGFTSRARRAGDDDLLYRWLAVGTVLASAARLNYVEIASTELLLVSPGDVLRICFYGALAIGAGYEIRAYWHRLARAAAAEERRRIARDLHDGLAQELAFIAAETHRLDRDPGDRDRVRMLSAAADRALAESRRAITSLGLDATERFHAVLSDVVADVGQRYGIDLTVDLDTHIDVPAPAREDVLRIVREAVTNACRHGGATHVNIRSTCDAALTLQVTDDGVGFDPDAAAPVGAFGLTSMRERARAIGGELRVTSSPGAGTVVEVRIP